MEIPQDKRVLLFDGECNLCNGFVRRIIQKDRKDLYRFASIQSGYGQKMISYLGINPEKIQSVVLYVPREAYYMKSEAVAEVLKSLGGYYAFLIFFNIFPKFISDILYDYIALKRYKWFRQHNDCMIKDATNEHRFLE